MYAEGRKANYHTKGRSTVLESRKIFLWTGASPGTGSSCGDPGVAQHSSLQGGKTQAREHGGQGGVGGLASGSDIRRLRLEFMGVVTSCLVRLDSHTGSASSWTSTPLATGASTPLTSPLSLCWKAAPDCPAPQDGRAT